MKFSYLVAAVGLASLPSFAEDDPSPENVAVQLSENGELKDTAGITYHKEGDHTFPDFAFTDINPRSASYQQSVSLDNILGHQKLVVVNFGHYGCPPCLAEMPDLERLHQSGNTIVVSLSQETFRIFSAELRNPKTPPSVFENAEKVLASITYPILGSAAEDQTMKSFYSSLPYHEMATTPNSPLPVYAIPLTIILRSNGIVDGYYIGADHTFYEKLSSVLEKIK